jgi:membrane-associated HD superfamily phosphohydrolase
MGNQGKGAVVSKSTAWKTAIVLPFFLVHPAMHAQKIYMCKDESGRTLTSDRPIPECEGRAIREFDKGGMVKRDIPPPLTPEQKRQQQIEEEKRKAEAAAIEERKREDRAIRARYHNESEVEAARKQAVDAIQEQIKRDKATLANAEKQQKQAHAEGDSYKQKNSPLPAGVKQRVEDADQAVDAAGKSLRDHEAEIGQINSKFDATLKRFRELMAEK